MTFFYLQNELEFEKVVMQEAQADTIEQYPCRAKLRFQGVPDYGGGEDTDSMIVKLINKHIKVEPRMQTMLNDGQSCRNHFSSLADVRLQFLDLTRAELDIAVLARLSCGIHLSSMTSSSRKGKQKERKVSSDHNIEVVMAQFIMPLKWTKLIINERTV